jgi:hypothetical protein
MAARLHSAFSILVLLISCTSPQSYFKKGEYTKAFNSASKCIDKHPRKASKFEPIFLQSFSILNRKDALELENSTIDVDNFDRLLRKVEATEARQKTVRDKAYVLNIANPASLMAWINTDSFTQLINETAFNHYYSKYQSTYASINDDKFTYAPLASNYLNKMERHQANGYNFASMYLDLITKGIAKTQVKYFNDTPNRRFNDLINDYNVQAMSKKWHQYSTDTTILNIDRILTIELKEIDPGHDIVNTSTKCHSREIIDRYETVIEKKEIPQPDKIVIVYVNTGDTLLPREVRTPQPPIIKEECKLVPIYVTVTAIETKTTVKKTAAAVVYLNLYDKVNDRLIFDRKKESFYTYTDYGVQIYGDTRAMMIPIFSSSHYPSTPDNATMMKLLKSSVIKDIYTEVKKM